MEKSLCAMEWWRKWRSKVAKISYLLLYYTTMKELETPVVETEAVETPATEEETTEESTEVAE